MMKNSRIDLTKLNITEEEIRCISQIRIIACGSAYPVGMAARYVIEGMAKIPVRVEPAPEFCGRTPLIMEVSMRMKPAFQKNL